MKTAAPSSPPAIWWTIWEVPASVVKSGVLKATLISAGIPTVFVNAEDIGYEGTELREAINTDPKRLARFRGDPGCRCPAHGAHQRPGRGGHSPAHPEKFAFVAPAKDYRTASGKEIIAGEIDLLVRALSMGKLHHAMMGTCAVAIGTGGGHWPRHPVNLAAGAASAKRCALATLRHPESRSPGRAGSGTVDGHQGGDVPLRPHPDGGLGAGPGDAFFSPRQSHRTR